ncbi:hypothetical protein PTT_08358 [Pyrenophora teres f. teres 0-1]|uniref:Uncharacterized protein n=1 Tax=Pyrenophora teres f. teres (strain 0-1) TaxID=861557 RepID=E3RJM2_PYRTT|nr:hypothetical protein PTT_08358 [Pyrenophora teres f. teres 0-1]
MASCEAESGGRGHWPRTARRNKAASYGRAMEPGQVTRPNAGCASCSCSSCAVDLPATAGPGWRQRGQSVGETRLPRSVEGGPVPVFQDMTVVLYLRTVKWEPSAVAAPRSWSTKTFDVWQHEMQDPLRFWPLAPRSDGFPDMQTP